MDAPLFGAGISEGDMKDTVVAAMKGILMGLHLDIVETNSDKPWGIEFKISDTHSKRFAELFFKRDDLPAAVWEHPFGPKMLLIEGSKRLSWHVHERKDAFLMVLKGSIDVYASKTDDQTEPAIAPVGMLVHIPELIRHRLGGRGGWSVVAEISRNVFPENPSNDSDERRISDDFGRI